MQSKMCLYGGKNEIGTIAFSDLPLVTYIVIYTNSTLLCTQSAVTITMMNEWMMWDFTSFSTVFQLYQDDGRLIMKGCV